MTTRTKAALVGAGLLVAGGLLYLASREDAPGVAKWEHEAEERRRYQAARARERELRRQRKAETRYQRRAAVGDIAGSSHEGAYRVGDRVEVLKTGDQGKIVRIDHERNRVLIEADPGADWIDQWVTVPDILEAA